MNRVVYDISSKPPSHDRVGITRGVGPNYDRSVRDRHADCLAPDSAQRPLGVPNKGVTARIPLGGVSGMSTLNTSGPELKTFAISRIMLRSGLRGVRWPIPMSRSAKDLDPRSIHGHE